MQTNYPDTISAASGQRSNRQTKTRQQFNHLTESLDLAVSEVKNAWFLAVLPLVLSHYFLRQHLVLHVHSSNLRQTVAAPSYSIASSGLFPALGPSVEHFILINPHQIICSILEAGHLLISVYLSNVWPKHLQSHQLSLNPAKAF